MCLQYEYGKLKDYLFKKWNGAGFRACFTPDGEIFLIALMDLQSRKSTIQKTYVAKQEC